MSPEYSFYVPENSLISRTISSVAFDLQRPHHRDFVDLHTASPIGGRSGDTVSGIYQLRRQQAPRATRNIFKTVKKMIFSDVIFFRLESNFRAKRGSF